MNLREALERAWKLLSREELADRSEELVHLLVAGGVPAINVREAARGSEEVTKKLVELCRQLCDIKSINEYLDVNKPLHHLMYHEFVALAASDYLRRLRSAEYKGRGA